MDIVNFPADLAKHGLLQGGQINTNDDLLIIGRKVNELRNGSQYQNFPILVEEFLTLVNAVPGPQGIQGIQGVQGVQGAQGIQGNTGAQGTAGNSITLLGSYADYAAFLAGAGSAPGGAIGDAWILLSDGSLMSWNGTAWFDAGDIKGPPGDQGPQGIQGVQGDQGVQGVQGNQGIAATIAAGSTTTGAPGSNATVTNVGTANAAIFNFAIPRGDVGATGPQGPAGLTGLFAQTADGGPVTATIVETTILGPGVGTLTVPANGFQIGNSFQASLDGIISCVGSATIHVRVKTLAGVLLADTGIVALDAATSKSWLLTLYFTIRTLGGAGTASISSGGLFSYIKNSGTNFEGYVLTNINNTTFDTTINNTLVVTVQWNTNNGGNSILSRNFTLTKIY